MQPNQQESLLTPAEVAALFRVDVKTVARWADAGKLECIRTPGNQRRFPEPAVRAALGIDPQSRPPLSHPVWRNPEVLPSDL